MVSCGAFFLVGYCELKGGLKARCFISDVLLLIKVMVFGALVVNVVTMALPLALFERLPLTLPVLLAGPLLILELPFRAELFA